MISVRDRLLYYIGLAVYNHVSGGLPGRDTSALYKTLLEFRTTLETESKAATDRKLTEDFQ